MDDAHSGVEASPQPIRHPVRRSGANTLSKERISYTVNLTGPFLDRPVPETENTVDPRHGYRSLQETRQDVWV